MCCCLVCGKEHRASENYKAEEVTADVRGLKDTVPKSFVTVKDMHLVVNMCTKEVRFKRIMGLMLTTTCSGWKMSSMGRNMYSISRTQLLPKKNIEICLSIASFIYGSSFSADIGARLM